MALSGQITVTTAGTAVQGPDQGHGTFLIKADPDNTDVVWVGNDAAGDVTSGNGFPLNVGEGIVWTGRLEWLYFDADVSAEIVCWLKTDG